ncbi:MAG: GH1 family beta-glucosidase [Flavitalea sp.]
MEFSREDFGEDFIWGVSTAAFQTEGAYQKNGKGISIWDNFTQKKGRIHGNANANIACDYFHNYPHDLTLMRAMNIRHHRFSISWSRIFPKGIGSINKSGIDFYNRVIDFCIELGIEPWITLYHWDLPLELEKKGGWTNREVINWFAVFIEACVKMFGDRVKNWIVLNEPMVFTGAGYFLGVHAPGRKSLQAFLASAHHAAMCQSEGGRIIRSIDSHSKIGTTYSCSHVDPFTNQDADISAAKRIDALLNRTFIEPILGLGYPVADLKILQRLEPFIRDGDEKKLAFDMDFIGIQNYTREIAAHSYFTPLIHAKIIKADARNVETTLMNWEVYPEGIYKMLKRYSNYKGINELIVTENGAAFPDHMLDGAVNDEKRKNYLQQYINQVLRARNEGVNVNGYFVWTFTDNFEWAEGYHPRFGLVHIDFDTQKRTVKLSGHWYSSFLKSARNGFPKTYRFDTFAL